MDIRGTGSDAIGFGDVATAAEILWAAARRWPDRPCLTDLDAGAGSTLTYAELERRVDAVAAGLAGLGLEPGDRVALLLSNGADYVEAWLGSSAAGMVVVPLNVRLVLEDYRHMLRDSGSRVLLTESEFLTRMPELREQPGLAVVCTGDPAAPERSSGLAPLLGTPGSAAGSALPPADPEEPASLMYTSGTTGSPKAVVLSHRSWHAVARRAAGVLGMGDAETTLHVAPLTHGAGFLLLPTLVLGGHNLTCRSFDAARTLTILDEHGVSGMFVVPSMIRMMLDARPADWRVPASFRRLYYAGSPIDAATMREATEVFEGRLVQSFAQMESPMFFTALDQDDHRQVLADPASPLVRSAGRVLPGVEVRILPEDAEDAGPDDTGRVVDGTVPPGTTGEVLARAPQTMTGYWNRPAESATALHDGWLHTGDIGLFDEAGYLYVVDRKKDMIVTGGSNVYAREVEEVLARLPGVREAAVVGMPHRVWGEAVTAVLVADVEVRDDAAVIDACRGELAGYRVPKRVVWVDALPRNAYGKVLKRRLREELAAADGNTDEPAGLVST